MHTAAAFASGAKLWAAAVAAETHEPAGKVLVEIIGALPVSLPALLPQVQLAAARSLSRRWKF